MNQEKIGKLIAKLRKEKGLTQRELGEMVGVGYRAVSKWETGLTMPDISIINELSTILGISSDELLKGELCSKETYIEEPTQSPKTFNNRKLLLMLIPLLIIIISLLTINNKDKSKEYIIQSLNPNDYLIEGTLAAYNNDLTIKIDKVELQNYNNTHNLIKNYEYKVTLNDNLIFGYGSIKEYSNIENNTSINDFFNNLQINYHDELKKGIKILDGGKMVITFKFVDATNNEINEKIETTLKFNK